MTKAQQHIVDEIKAGCTLIRSFDVYGGYWWWLRPTQKRVQKRTAEAMERAGLIVAGENKRIASGYHEKPYTLASKDL